MPKKINIKMFSPCGMNCAACYVHLRKNKSCKGCLFDDPNKPERCKSCEIKNCAKEKRFIYCFKCPDFPCKKIINLDKSYQKRYQISLVENSKTVSAKGFEYFFKKEYQKWICPKCASVISIHDKKCYKCEQ